MAMFDREATLDDVREDARELLRGAIDVHVHAAPDPYAERRLPSDVLVQRAVEAGMGGLVLKSHEYNTQPLAWLLDQQNEDIRVYGGIALDHGVGGLNMEAVSVAMLIGTTMVWMPTFDAQAWRDARPGGRHSPAPGITVLDEMGDLRHEVMAILDLIHEHDAVLATGHLSTPEVAVLGARRGVAGSGPSSRTARSTSTSKCSRSWPASGPTWSRWRRPPATRTARSSGSCSSPRSAPSGPSA